MQLIDVEFESLTATVETEDHQHKQVLKNVSGSVTAGQMLAIMGPTGCGKSSLLNALSGRFDGDLEGWITFNRQPGTSAMKRLIAYVTQDDVLPPVLTVHEMLMFHTRLRSNEPLQTSQIQISDST